MKYFSGTLYRDSKFSGGYIGVEDGVINRVGRGECPSTPEATGIILPTFVNAHTHIGDSAIRLEPKPDDSYMELIAPPHGFKHKALALMPKMEIIDGMRQSLEIMIKSGTSVFVDFRESGIMGVKMINIAMDGLPPIGVVLGRPRNPIYVKKEIDNLLKICDGIGASSVSDWNYSELQKVAMHAQGAGKYFALHASERVREDIDKILDLKPGFVIHMLEATDSDLERCADSHTPIVICPRSNLFFGKIPDIPRFLRHGCTLMLGTDNAMLARPDFFTELETSYRLSRLKGGVEASKILTFAIENPRKTLNADGDIGLSEGARADFMVLKIHETNPEFVIVAHGSAQHVVYVQAGKWHWRRNR